MKKIMAIISLVVCLAAQAQLQPVLKNRRGINILPQKGDICLGISAVPFLGYIGNMFTNNGSNTAPGFTSFNQMVFAKYMKTSQLAYRGGLWVNANTQNSFVAVKDFSPGAPGDATVTDKSKNRNSLIGVSIGIEKRRGDTRLQGFYGLEYFTSYSSGTRQVLEYGNKIENYPAGTSRQIEISGRSQISLGVNAFAGIEYFVAPRISFGGELGFGPAVRFEGPSSYTMESYDFNTSQVMQTKIDQNIRTTTFSLSQYNNNYNGALRLLFYF